MTLRQLIFFFLFLLVGVSCKSGKKSATSINKHSAALLTPSAQIQTMNRGAIATPSALNCRDNEDCEVRNGEIRLLETSLNVKKLTINGTLRCAPDLSGELEADVIYVNGTFECGTEQNRFMGSLTISLKHSEQEGEAYRGFIVNRNGVLILHGDTKNSGFVKLNKTAHPTETSIELETNNGFNGASPSSWAAGDKIVVASTSYNPEESEVFSMTGKNGTNLTLNGSLQHRHHGGKPKDYPTRSGNGSDVCKPNKKRELDRRAEVANLTRNIRIQAAEERVSDELGGHVMVHEGGKAFIDAVEFYQMGQAGRIGRYPFHWHLVGNVRGQYLKNSSIHQSFQRCVIIHRTDWAHVENNVCFDFKGHGFMLEDGVEINNTLEKNLAIHAKYPQTEKALRPSERAGAPGIDNTRFAAVSSFWISHPSNWIMDNIASGSVGSGFWNSFDSLKSRTFRQPTHNYSGNIAHTTLVGHTWDGIEIPPEDRHKFNNNEMTSSHYFPQKIPVFPCLQAFRNRLTGIYYRGSTAIFDKLIVEGNRWSLFLTNNQIIQNSLIIGEDRTEQETNDPPLPLEEVVGIVLYDGPFELNRVDFMDFDKVSKYRPLRTIGGFDKWVNTSRRLRFDPEPMRRIYSDTSDPTWLDFGYSNSIRDLDGTLTGSRPGIIVSKANLTSSGCEEDRDKFEGMVVCPSSHRLFNIRVESQSQPKYTGCFPDEPARELELLDGVQRSLFKVSWGNRSSTADIPENWEIKVKCQGMHNNKFLLVAPASSSDTLQVNFLENFVGRAKLTVKSERPNLRTPFIEMKREGDSRSCRKRVKPMTKERDHLIKHLNRNQKVRTGEMSCSW